MDLFNAEEVAKILGISKSVVYRHRVRGAIEDTNLGGVIVFSRAALEKFIGRKNPRLSEQAVKDILDSLIKKNLS